MVVGIVYKSLQKLRNVCVAFVFAAFHGNSAGIIVAFTCAAGADGGVNFIATDLEVLAGTFCLSPLTTANAGLSHVNVKSVADANTFRKGMSRCPPGAIVKGPCCRC